MTAFSNATDHSWVAKKTANFRYSKAAILVILMPFGKPFKNQLTKDY